MRAGGHRRRASSVVVGVALALAATVLGPVAPARAATVAVTLTPAATTVTYGAEVRFTATVTVDGAPATDADLALQRTDAQGRVDDVDFAYVTNGSAALEDFNATGNATYVAVATIYDDLGNPTDGVSSPVSIGVAPDVEAELSPSAVPPGGTASVVVQVRPGGAGTALVEQRTSSGWRSLGEHAVRPNGTVTVPVGRHDAVGRVTFRVTRLADSSFAAGSVEADLVVTTTGAGPKKAWRPLAGTKARPAHWRTCRIGYRVNPKRMPVHGMADLREAIRRVTMVSGIRFRYLGTTKHVPHATYTGAGLNKITVAWATNKSTRGLLPSFVGGVGGTAHGAGGRILTGYVAMNTAFTNRADPGFGEGSPHGLVLMHELGHVLGLGHTNNVKQIMHGSSSQPASVWGAGDITGLRALGRASGCLR